MKIKKISIDKIKPYENNAKLHPPEQIEQIKNQLRSSETMIQLRLMKIV